MFVYCKKMPATGVSQIVGIKIDVFEFFVTILENYCVTKEYTKKIVRIFPPGVDEIIGNYINYYDIPKIYRYFQEFISKYNKDHPENSLTMDLLIDSLKNQYED